MEERFRKHEAGVADFLPEVQLSVFIQILQIRYELHGPYRIGESGVKSKSEKMRS